MIPVEAVEAAAKGIFDVRDDPYDLDEWGDLDAIAREPYVCHARAALEAAAPHMLAAAWQEGYLYSYDQERGGNGKLPIPVPGYLAEDLVRWNPYRTTKEAPHGDD